MCRIILLASALGAAHAAEKCTAMSGTIDSGMCKGTKMIFKACLPEEMTSDTAFALVFPDDPCSQGASPASHAQGE